MIYEVSLSYWSSANTKDIVYNCSTLEEAKARYLELMSKVDKSVKSVILVDKVVGAVLKYYVSNDEGRY